MRQNLTSVIIALACSVMPAAAETGPAGVGSVELVHEGKARAIVVIAENPTRAAHVAAKEFIHYVKQMTGVELPLHVDGAAPRKSWAPRRVLIGESLLTREHGLANADFEEQEYLIETRGEDLILMGRDVEEYGIVSYEENGLWPTAGKGRSVLLTPMGSLYAVDTFLEKYGGVRWYLPGEIGEVCPRHDRLLFTNIRERAKPWTDYRFSSRQGARDPFHFYGHADPDRRVTVPARDMTLWMLRMKIGGRPFACNHSFTSYFNRFGEAHPEWWKEGKPTSAWPHPDYANPELMAQAAQDAIDYFDGRYPDGHYPDGSAIMASGDHFAVMPLDGRKGLIWSEAGEKLRNNDPAVQEGFSCGWASDFVFNMVRQVAETVAARHPDKWLTCAAYAPYFNPPRNRADFPKNVAIQHCGFMHRTFDAQGWDYETANLRAWTEIVSRVYTWEYYLVQSECQFKAFPVVYPRQVAKAVQFMHSVGVKGMFFEASAAPAGPDKPWTDALFPNPAEDLLNHYVTWKLLGDASLDVEKLLAEHFRLFYGPAEKPMREFFTLIEQRWSDPEVWKNKDMGTEERSWSLICSPEILRRLEALVGEAETAAVDEPFRSRVRLMREAVYQPTERRAMRFWHRHEGRARLLCPLAAVPPAVDGVLNDPAWTNAPRTAPWVTPSNRPVPTEATAQALRDGSNLFVAVACAGTAGADERVTVALDVGRRRGGAFLLTIGPDGALEQGLTGEAKDARWAAEADVRTARTDAGWTAEIRIPLAALGVDAVATGQAWGLNLQRARGAEISQWHPTFGNLNALNEYGVLTFADGPDAPGDTPLMAYDFEALGPGPSVPDRAGTGSPATPSPGSLRTAAGGAPWSATNLVPGVRGNGLRFGGAKTLQYLHVAPASAINLSDDDFTIAFWIKPDQPAGVILHSTTSPPYWGLTFREADRICFAINGGDGQATGAVMSRPVALADGGWHLLVLMVDRGRDVRAYIDGDLVLSGAIHGQRGSLKPLFTIGGPYGYFEGAIDEFSLRQGTFGQAEARQWFQAGRPDGR